jgi:hypothetical protein
MGSNHRPSTARSNCLPFGFRKPTKRILLHVSPLTALFIVRSLLPDPRAHESLETVPPLVKVQRSDSVKGPITTTYRVAIGISWLPRSIL